CSDPTARCATRRRSTSSVTSWRSSARSCSGCSPPTPPATSATRGPSRSVARRRLVARLGQLLAQPSALLPALGVVAHDRRDGLRCAAPGRSQQGDGERDREGAAVAVEGRDLEELVAVAGLAGGHRLAVA